MSAYKNIALVGANGNVGKPVLDALIKAGFNVTAISREGSTSSFPSGVKVVHVDFSSVDSLVSALSGIDAVVSTVGAPGLESQPALVEAAIKAGVKRFIPSEYGCDTLHEKTSKLPVFGGKVATSTLLKEKADKGEIEYTFLTTGPFLDWVVFGPLGGLDIANKKITTIYDGGKYPFSTSSLADVGKAIAAILSNPNETANKQLFVNTAVFTQSELFDTVEKALGITLDKSGAAEVSTAALEQDANEKLAKGDFSAWLNWILRAIYAPGYGADFTGKIANLGVEAKSGAELEAVMKSLSG